MKRPGQAASWRECIRADPSLYGAIKEQMILLDRDDIPYEIVPGVTVAFAAAAKVSFTLPEKAQTLILYPADSLSQVPRCGRGL